MTRLLLVVMLATFLSPTLAWHLHAGHHEISADADAGNGHDHGGSSRAASDALGDAHASIGHLLGHMPMHLSRPEVLLPVVEEVVPSAEVSSLLLSAQASPPYRPPSSLRLA